MEKVSRRINELEAVNNNVKLLSEMLDHYRANKATEADRDLMKVGLRFSVVISEIY